MSHASDESKARVIDDSARTRRGLACLIVLLVGLILAASLVYFLGNVFAKWFVPK